jgi:hypothetical protein
MILFVGLEPEMPKDNFSELKSSYYNMFLLFVNNQKVFIVSIEAVFNLPCHDVATFVI